MYSLNLYEFVFPCCIYKAKGTLIQCLFQTSESVRGEIFPSKILRFLQNVKMRFLLFQFELDKNIPTQAHIWSRHW